VILPAALAMAPSFPSAGSSGATLPGSLYTVASGSTASAAGSPNAGWSYSGTTWTIAANAVLYGLSAPALPVSASGVTVAGCAIAQELQVAASAPTTGVTVENCVITSSGGGTTSGIYLGGGGLNVSTDTTILNCTVSGSGPGSGRVDYCINDGNGSSIGTLVQGCDLYWMRIGVNLGVGTIRDCWMHDFGYDFGYTPQDHTDGIYAEGTVGPLYILHNTILNQLGQTDAIYLGGLGPEPTSNVTISDNLLAGGDYVIYGGQQQNWANQVRSVTASGTTSVSDTSAAATDLGATVTGTGVPAGTTIASVTAGSGYTASASIPGTTTSLTLHYTKGIVVTSNRVSQVFFPSTGGYYGVVADFDAVPASNLWAGNVWHDTGVAIAS
jgi:hypothetical protein